VVGTGIVLVLHVMMVRLAGRFWRTDGHAPLTLLNRLTTPVSALTSWVVARRRSVAAIAVLLTIPLGAGFLAVAPENSVSEMLPANSPMVRALKLVDSELGGVYPVQIIVPMDGVAVDSLEGLGRIRAVHEAVSGLGASDPESLWSLVEWVGGDPADALALLAEFPTETRQAFIAQAGALVTVNLNDMSTADLGAAIDRIESAARAAVAGTIVTGAAVVGAREATRTIRSLTVNLGFAVVVAMTLIALAFRSVAAGLVAVIPNVFPVVATGAVIHLMGDGMQIASIVSLTIAFGIAIDDTVHYLSALFLTRGGDLRTRMIAASRRVGPVLVATTAVLVGGMLMTQTSGLATVVLFGLLAMGAFIAALIGDLVFLPALIAGPLRRLFSPHMRGSVGAGLPELK
jgi:predicted RND superfamily exporter protein